MLRIDSIIVLALATLAGAGTWDSTLSTNIHTLHGHTVMLKHGALVVLSPTGVRKEVSL
jgi:hypothetical protein